MATSTQTRPATEHPVYWFAILSDARDRNNRRLIAIAMEQLRRLGVRVTYTEPQAMEVAHG